MYEFKELDISALPLFQPLIPKTNITPDPDQKLIIYGAFKQQMPVGICMAQYNPPLNFLEVLHLEVEKQHRNQHIGRTLLAKTQKLAKENGAHTLSLIYQLGEDTTPAIEKILQANEWEGSRLFLVRALFEMKTFNAPFIHLTMDYPRRFKEFLWAKLNQSQRKDLIHRQQQEHFPKIVSPFRDEAILEPINSLGLMHKERIVGWLITHRTDPETIRYSALYLEPSLRFQGAAIKMLIDSIKLHLQNPTKWGLLEIPYIQVHPSWIHFFEHRLLPYATTVTRLQQAWHTV